MEVNLIVFLRAKVEFPIPYVWSIFTGWKHAHLQTNWMWQLTAEDTKLYKLWSNFQWISLHQVSLTVKCHSSKNSQTGSSNVHWLFSSILASTYSIFRSDVCSWHLRGFNLDNVGVCNEMYKVLYSEFTSWTQKCAHFDVFCFILFWIVIQCNIYFNNWKISQILVD